MANKPPLFSKSHPFKAPLSKGPPSKEQEEMSNDAESSSLDTVDPPPDGGLPAWSQVLMSHLVSFNAWGYLNSFGLFQAYYVSTLPHTTPSAVSWIGSIQILLAFLVGSISGRALDAGYLRHTLALGSLLQIIGIMGTSVATEYWQLVLAQGVAKGLGDGLAFCPAVAVVPTYFVRKRALAMAVAASGTATGGLVFPVMARELMPRVGFAWTVRAMGLVVIVNAAVILGLARARVGPDRDQKKPWFEWRAFRERGYTLFCVGMFLNWWALYFAFFYVSAFAKTQLGVDTSTSLTLLFILNAAGAPSRVIFGLIADRFFGPLTTLIPVAFCTGILFYSWAGVTSLGALYAFCALYGFFGAAIQGLFPASCASLTTDMRTMGARTGMCFAVVSFAALTGPPIGGALIQIHGSYLPAQMFGGSALIAGTLALVAAKYSYKTKPDPS